MFTVGTKVLSFVIAAIALAGCATYGVAPKLKPYTDLVTEPPGVLCKNTDDIVQVLPENQYAALPGSHHVVCRTSKGLFLAQTKGAAISTTKAVFLGDEPDLAVQAISNLRNTILQQQQLAEVQAAMILLPGLAAASQIAEQNSVPQPRYIPPRAQPVRVPEERSPYAEKAKQQGPIQYSGQVDRNGDVTLSASDGSYLWGEVDRNGQLTVHGSDGSYGWGQVDKSGQVSGQMSLQGTR